MFFKLMGCVYFIYPQINCTCLYLQGTRFNLLIIGNIIMTERLSPGTKAPDSGQYKEVGPRGGKVSDTEVTSTKGKPLPPTSKPGNKYVVVDKTKHKK